VAVYCFVFRRKSLRGQRTTPSATTVKPPRFHRTDGLPALWGTAIRANRHGDEILQPIFKPFHEVRRRRDRQTFKRLHRYRFSPTAWYGIRSSTFTMEARRLSVREASHSISADEYLCPRIDSFCQFKLICMVCMRHGIPLACAIPFPCGGLNALPRLFLQGIVLDYSMPTKRGSHGRPIPKKRRSEIMAASPRRIPYRRSASANLGRDGYRFAYTAMTLKADIVLPKWKTVILVHGCFWHGHDCCEGHVQNPIGVLGARSWIGTVAGRKNAGKLHASAAPDRHLGVPDYSLRRIEERLRDALPKSQAA